jgi:organic radical activating enzyme
MIPVIKGIHLEPTNICSLRCPGCARTRFIEQWPQHWRNHSLETDVLMSFLDIDLDSVVVSLCGNYGDPIYHPDLPKMIASLKARGASVVLTTNGSHRKENWWTDLVTYLDSRDSVIFSIDGLPENFTKYRINGDWSTIECAVKVCVAAKINAIWKFIPFSFNQQDIDSARDLSRQLGMSDFQLTPSARFDAQTADFIPMDHLILPLKSAQDDFKKGKFWNVDPKCHQGDQHYISADGYYSPCCFVTDHRFYYKTVFGKQKKQFDIRHYTLTQLLGQDPVTDFFRTLTTDPPSVCRFSCPDMAVDQ